ncbi:putative serine/threonine-protein kinase-like protein CCR3 [Hordeum vulgare]|nr:putative serine/threonine-protein kinase-like protein CCR3 [Hordeum vulgare]
MGLFDGLFSGRRHDGVRMGDAASSSSSSVAAAMATDDAASASASAQQCSDGSLLSRQPAQLVGADVGGLISMIVQAATTAQQNKSECEQLARRVLIIAQLLPHVQEPEAAQPLTGLGDTLRDAHELVVSCEGWSAVKRSVSQSTLGSINTAPLVLQINRSYQAFC